MIEKFLAIKERERDEGEVVVPQIQIELEAREPKPGRSPKRKRRDNKWLLKATCEAILVILCVSLVYAIFLVIDWLITFFLASVLSDLIAKYVF